MRVVYFAAFLLLKLFTLNGQSYVNRAIDFPTGSFLSLGMDKINDKYVVTIGGSIENAVLFTDLQNDFFLFIPDLACGSNPSFTLHESLKLLGRDIDTFQLIRILDVSELNGIKNDGFILLLDSTEYIPSNLINANGAYYFGLNKINSKDIIPLNEFSIFKFRDGNFSVINNTIIQGPYVTIYPSDLEFTQDSKLLFACQIYFTGIEGWNGYVIKLDTLGSRIFMSDTLIRPNIIYPKMYVIELSDQSTLVCYHQDMHGVVGWHEYYPYMPTYTWLDSAGKITRQIIPRIKRPAEVVSSGVLAGRGDYFFSYGEVTLLDRDDYYGYITKYSNAGDTIWSHLYRHPDYQAGRYSHEINHLIEDENGDLVGTGRIAEPNTAGKIWLLRVNANGCFGEDGCAELTLSGHKGPDKEESKVQLYPNPNSGGFDLVSSKEIRAIRIINPLGMDQQFSANSSYGKVQLIGPKSGIYFITIYYGDGSREICKIVKN